MEEQELGERADFSETPSTAWDPWVQGWAVDPTTDENS